jgi:hypothetical protein
MDQGVIKAFKTYYVRRIMNQVNSAIDGPDSPTVREFWCNYNIRKAIENVGASWDEVTQVTVNGVWRKLWLECCNKFRGFEQTVKEIQREIVQLAHQAGFDEVDEADIA